MKHTLYRQLQFDSIVDILTDKYPAIIQIPGEKDNKQKNTVAANYGDMSLKFLPDSSISLRGFNHNGEAYMIDNGKKELIKVPQYSRLLSEIDKIQERPLYYYEGTTDDILKEFQDAKYNIVNKNI